MSDLTDLYLCPVCDAVIETPAGVDPTCPNGPHVTVACPRHGERTIDLTKVGANAEHQPGVGMAGIGDHRYRCVLDVDHESDHRGVRCDRGDSEDVYVWPNVES